MDEKIEQYILDIVFASRFPDQFGLEKYLHMIQYGGSPRASINLAMGSKAYAFIKRRGYVIPEDVRAVCHDIMRHRIGLTPPPQSPRSPQATSTSEPRTLG